MKNELGKFISPAFGVILVFTLRLLLTLVSLLLPTDPTSKSVRVALLLSL